MTRKPQQSLLNLSELPTIDSSRFYHANSSHSTAHPKHLPHIATLQKLQQQHLHLDANEKNEHCRFFTRQDAAFRAFDSLQPHLQCHNKIYTYETEIQGKRQFIMADNRVFIEDYFKIPLNNRHIYEIIRYTFPCRLYFDLEYHRPSNPTIDGYRLTERWIDLVIWKLRELYGIIVKKRDILVLDSTTEEKFSKHVIFSILSHDATSKEESNSSKEYLFPDNQEMSRVIRAILLDITQPFRENKDNERHKYVNNNNIGAADTISALVFQSEGVQYMQNNKNTNNGFNNDSINNNILNIISNNDGNTRNNNYLDNNDTVDDNTNNTESDIIQIIDGEFRSPYAEYRCFWLHTQSSAEENSSAAIVNKRQFFVDIGVYTKNRAFRLYGSCKHSKKKMLGVDARDETIYYKYNSNNSSNNVTPQFASLKRKDIVLRAFVIPVDIFSNKLCFQRNNNINNTHYKANNSPADNSDDTNKTSGHDDQTTSSGVHSNEYHTFATFEYMFNRDKYMLLPRLGEDYVSIMNGKFHGQKRPFDNNNNGDNIDCIYERRMQQRCLSLSDSFSPSQFLLSNNNYDFNTHNTVKLNYLHSYPLHNINNNHSYLNNNVSWKQHIVLQSTSARQHTPFAPLLDSFLLFHFAQNRGQCPSGHFSQWFIYSYKNINGVTSYKLRMMIQNNRYCRVIQRAHKSNGIYVECELMTGEVQQKCWDADCQQIRHQKKHSTHNSNNNNNRPEEVFHLPKGLIPKVPEEIIQLVEQAATPSHKTR